MSGKVWQVVIIDDSPDDRAEVRRLLLNGSDRRYKFTEAETGAGGIQACLGGKGPPACVVLDYHLPDMDALEVLAALTGPDGLLVCPVAVLTGSAGRDSGMAVLQAGAQDFLGKSWMTPESLTRAVENAAERFRLTQAVRAAEVEIRNRQRELQALVDNTPSLLTRFDREFRHVFVNVAVEKATGRPAADFLGKTSRELGMPDGLCDQWEAAVRYVFESRQHKWIEYTSDAPAGRRQYATQLVPEVGSAGAVEFVLGVTTDVTDRRLAEAEARESDRRKDEFLATLAHELRNPLAPIQNGVEIMKLSGLRSGALGKTIDMMDRQLGQMTRLIDDLLDVSRITSGKLHRRRERVSLATVVSAAVEATLPLIARHGHELTVAPVADGIHLDGDPTRLVQVVTNLLNNAAKYTERDGRIALTALRDGGEVVVSVRDNGIGIPQGMLTKVFGMFSQVDRALEKTTGGLGIGLALVKGLVEMHGGRIEARSEGEGRGSEFIVRLPALPDETTEEARPMDTATATTGKKVRILVVDDNPDSADSMAVMLELFGNETRTARDGEAGVREAEAFGPQVVFLDLGMPKMNGYEACRRIRVQPWGRDMVLIALTGWGTDDDRRQTQQAGFDHHLTKPVNPADLRAMLESLTLAPV